MQEMTDDQSTRERMLETIDRLFYRQGIRAVGVDAIVAELGISKKTLYSLLRRFKPYPVSDFPPAEQILANFEWLEKSLVRSKDFRGCAYLNALAELGEDERDARKVPVEIKDGRRL